MGHKAAETTRNINNTFVQSSGASRSFAKKTRALKMRRVMSDHRKSTTENHHWSWPSYNYTGSCQRSQHWPFYGHWAFVVNWWKVKKLAKWVPPELTENQNNCCFEVSSNSIQQQWTISQSDCDVWQQVLYENRWQAARELDQEAAPSTCQSQTCTRERAMATTGWSAAGVIHYSFLNPGKTVTSDKYAQHIDETHRKLQGRQQALVNRKGPIPLHNACLRVAQPTLQKSANWTMKLCLTHHIHLTSRQWITSSILSTTSCRQNVPQPAGGRKCFSRVHWSLKHGFLHYRNKLLSQWQKCADCNASYFD